MGRLDGSVTIECWHRNERSSSVGTTFSEPPQAVTSPATKSVLIYSRNYDIDIECNALDAMATKRSQNNLFQTTTQSNQQTQDSSTQAAMFPASAQRGTDDTVATREGIPWWAILLIVLAGLVVIAAAVVVAVFFLK